MNIDYVMLEKGQFHLNFKYREPNYKLDRIVITSDRSFNPSGIDDMPGTSEGNRDYDIYPEPEIKPIAQHPRLLATEDTIPSLKSNMQTEKLNTAYNIAAAYAREELDDAIAAAAGGYDLLTDDDKDFFTSRLKGLAAKKEIGYPPTKLSSIGAHSGEYEIMCDMLSVGIAVYDEDPEIYNLAAGRFFAEYIDSREMFNQSGNHPQGNSYGAFRFECELWAKLIFERMGYKNVFGEGMEEVAYKWIYERLPFGAWFKDGDDTAISKYSYFNYSTYDIRTQILCGNMFKNPVLKRQYLKELSLYEYNPSFIWLLVIADPDTGIEEVNNLPLARPLRRTAQNQAVFCRNPCGAGT